MTDVSVAEDNCDNCSSVCSADSGELEMEDVSYHASSNNSSPTGSLQRSQRQNVDNCRLRSELDNTDLNSVPLGSLDYEHLMNYFESLKESAA